MNYDIKTARILLGGLGVLLIVIALPFKLLLGLAGLALIFWAVEGNF